MPWRCRRGAIGTPLRDYQRRTQWIVWVRGTLLRLRSLWALGAASVGALGHGGDRNIAVDREGEHAGISVVGMAAHASVACGCEGTLVGHDTPIELTNITSIWVLGEEPPQGRVRKTFVFSSRRVHVPIVFGVCSLVSPLVDATPYPLTFISRMLCGSCVLHRSIPFFVRCSSEFGAKRWVY